MLRLKEWEIEGEGKWMMEVDKKIGNYSEESLKERREGKPRGFFFLIHNQKSVMNSSFLFYSPLF